MIREYGCPETHADGEGRRWECMAPRGHQGACFWTQVEGPEYDPGDFGGMST